MKIRYLFNVLAVAGLIATLVTCYYFYDYNRREGLSSVVVWGTAPLMVFVVITSILQLRRSIRSYKRR
jgi:drug/metabolite transporter superfamily protein YnfA